MATARLDGSKIHDWASFHDVSSQQLGFPPFYGRNMNAWIDCLTHLDLGDGMSRFHLQPGELLELEITDSQQLKRDAPDVFEAVVEATESINNRYVERGQPPMLQLIVK